MDLGSTILSFVIFGAAIVYLRPIYALVLLLCSLPTMFVQFQMVSKWWNLFQKLIPEHKKRGVLERPYYQNTAFLQALMFNQMSVLRRQIDQNTDGIVAEYDKLRTENLRKVILASVASFVGVALVTMLTISDAWYGVIEYGTLTILISAAKTFQGNFESIVTTVADQWNAAKGVLIIEREFFALKPMITTEYPVVPNPDLVPKIEIKNVSFAYPNAPDKRILDDVSLTFEPGSKVAIAGKTGCGQSTLRNLLLRLYDPTGGSIFAGGVNLRNIDPRDWSKIASCLTQNYSILERPICEEIASSNMDKPLDMERIREASMIADFDEVATSQKDGYNTQIGQEFGGCELSGGQLHRLALARVVHRRTPVLILDEPDASLDPETAEKVLDRILSIPNITIIMITHHVSRAEKCDQIVMMSQGKVVENGSHAELIRKDSLYARMYKKDKDRIGRDASEESPEV